MCLFRSAVSIMTGLRTRRSRLDSRQEQWMDFCLRYLAQTGCGATTAVSRPALGPTQPPSKWVPRALSQGQSGRGIKLTTHFHLVPRLRMRGAIPPLLIMSSWWRCLVKHKENFTRSGLRTTGLLKLT